jgi:hypothetical protein
MRTLYNTGFELAGYDYKEAHIKEKIIVGKCGGPPAWRDTLW